MTGASTDTVIHVDRLPEWDQEWTKQVETHASVRISAADFMDRHIVMLREMGAPPPTRIATSAFWWEWEPFIGGLMLRHDGRVEIYIQQRVRRRQRHRLLISAIAIDHPAYPASVRTLVEHLQQLVLYLGQKARENRLRFREFTVPTKDGPLNVKLDVRQLWTATDAPASDLPATETPAAPEAPAAEPEK
jgi:hypothetical protein